MSTTESAVPNIQIRRCSSADADELSRIARAAKSHWGYPEEWLKLWEKDLTFRPDYIRANPVYKAVSEGSTVGVYGLGKLDSRPELEHLWVDPAWLGRGIGRLLVDHARRTARRLGVRSLHICSDPHADDFYCKMGARRVGEVPTLIPGRTLPLLVLECGDRAPTAKAAEGRRTAR